MASTSVTCESNVWTLVSENNKQGRIRTTLTNPTKYYYDVVDTGAAAPSSELDSGTKVLPPVWNFQFRSSVDIYIYAFDYAGRVDFDTDAPYQDVFIQDQTTDVIVANFNQVTNSTTLNGAVAIDDRIIIVTSATGIVEGSYIILFNPASVRFTPFFAIGVAGTSITLDGPIDFDYPDGTFVDVAITDLSVDGSGTPEVFGLRGTGIPPGVDLKFDITRIIFEMTCDSAISLDLFGNITALTRGLLVRTRNARYKNIFNVKTNGEIAGVMYDWTPFESINPNQGIDGFIARLTFGGQSKIGVVIRLALGEDLEVHIQDNLTAITSFKMIVEGHIVD